MRGDLGLGDQEPDRYLTYNRPEQTSWFPTSYSGLALALVFLLSVNDATSDPLLRPECRNPNSCPHSKSISKSSQHCPQHAGDPIMSAFPLLPARSKRPSPTPGSLWGLIIGLLTAQPSSLLSVHLTGSGINRIISLPLLKHSSLSHTEDKSRLPPRLCDPSLSPFQAMSYSTFLRCSLVILLSALRPCRP